MIEYRDIGVKNTYAIYKSVILIVFCISICPVILFWVLFGIDYQNNQFLNGVEVQANVIDKFIVDDYDDEGYYTGSHYEYEYEYVSPEGKVYRDSTGYRYNLEIGDTIKIVIDPDSTNSTIMSLSEILNNKNDIYRDFPLACVFSGLFCVTAYLFFYRVVYRNALDKKILKFYGNGYLKNGLSEGEVIKTFKWIVGYVKIRYRDENDLAKEKWARSWFTLRETKFLEEKKYVNIILYKNTYGILEEMPATR